MIGFYIFLNDLTFMFSFAIYIISMRKKYKNGTVPIEYFSKLGGRQTIIHAHIFSK